MDQLFAGVIGFILMAFIGIFALLWIILPFSIFGIKGKLDQIIKLLKESN